MPLDVERSTPLLKRATGFSATLLRKVRAIRRLVKVKYLKAAAGGVIAFVDHASRFTVKVAIFGVGCLLVVVTVDAIFGDFVVIEPVAVPQALQDDGFSGAVVTRRLVEQIQIIDRGHDPLAIGQTSKSSDDEATPAGRRKPQSENQNFNTSTSHVKYRSEDDFSAMNTIQLPSSGLTLRSMASMLRSALGIPERKIGGEITIRRSADATGAPVYALKLRFGSSYSLPEKTGDAQSIDKVIQDSAPD